MLFLSFFVCRWWYRYLLMNWWKCAGRFPIVFIRRTTIPSHPIQGYSILLKLSHKLFNLLFLQIVGDFVAQCEADLLLTLMSFCSPCGILIAASASWRVLVRVILLFNMALWILRISAVDVWSCTRMTRKGPSFVGTSFLDGPQAADLVCPRLIIGGSSTYPYKSRSRGREIRYWRTRLFKWRV